jgi:predicted small lipoprotein YifL
MMRSVSRLVAACVAAITLACGQKGPPLPPLHLLPAAPVEATVRRVGADARIRFTIPSTNVNGPGAIDLDRLEIFAATVAPGAAVPSNREFLTPKYRVGTIAVKPPPVEGETPPANAPPDTRPSAGEKTTFVEKLTPEVLKPVFITPAAKPSGTAATAAAAATAKEEPPPTYAIRIYAVRGVTKSGRPGQPSPRLQLPLLDPPAPPVSVTATHSETAITLAWKPPVSDKSAAFNVYKVGGSDPINSAPVTEPTYERAGLEFGKQECFAVRAVEKAGTADAESELSEPACVTPKDTFPPKAPQHLSAVGAPGVISLSWDANTEPDLAGYMVLRGEAPGDTLQPLTPTPITATSFEDKTGKPGVRYAYAIVAVDKATPPNRSSESNRIEETAR